MRREGQRKRPKTLIANLKVKAMPGLACSPLEIAERCWDFREKDKECFAVFFLNTKIKSSAVRLSA